MSFAIKGGTDKWQAIFLCESQLEPSLALLSVLSQTASTSPSVQMSPAFQGGRKLVLLRCYGPHSWAMGKRQLRASRPVCENVLASDNGISYIFLRTERSFSSCLVRPCCLNKCYWFWRKDSIALPSIQSHIIPRLESPISWILPYLSKPLDAGVEFLTYEAGKVIWVWTHTIKTLCVYISVMIFGGTVGFLRTGHNKFTQWTLHINNGRPQYPVLKKGQVIKTKTNQRNYKTNRHYESMDLTDIHRIFHPNTKQFALLAPHRTFFKTI